MSFGASPSDIIILVNFCRQLYRNCRNAGGEYDEISREVRGLHTVLRHLKYEVEDEDSILNRDRAVWGRQLAQIVGDCDFTLRQLDGLLQKYGRLSADGSSTPPSSRVLWDKIRFGSNEMDQLGAFRGKLISHKTSLTLFLDTIQLRHSGNMANTLTSHGDQLAVVLDKVDRIAARMGGKAGSLMTAYDNDDKQVWKQFRRELVAEGFSSDVLSENKDILRAYIREIDQKGILDDHALPNPRSLEEGIDAAQWAESVASSQSQSLLPSLRSSSPSERRDEDVIRKEEMLKFAGPMSLRQRLPEDANCSQPGSEALRAQNSLIRQPLPEQSSMNTSQTTAQQYELDTPTSDDESSSGRSSQRSASPSKAVIIRTSDLIAADMSLQVHPGTSPSSFRSNASFGTNMSNLPKFSMAYPLQNEPPQLYGASPLRSGSLPINISTSSRLEVALRPQQIMLKPDHQGREIPPDAKWTKIKRSVVSPEVLHQDRRRFEARQDFIAVLGILTREEIQDYAIRTHELREARRRHSRPPPPARLHVQATLPAQQPVRSPHPRRPRSPASDSDSDSTDTDTDSDRSHHQRRHHHHRRLRNDGSRRRHNEYKQHDEQPPSQPKRVTFLSPPGTPKHASTHSSSAPRSGDRRDDGRGRDADKRRGKLPKKSARAGTAKVDAKPVSRWKETLAAASLGGAAATMLEVLAEAAAEF